MLAERLEDRVATLENSPPETDPSLLDFVLSAPPLGAIPAMVSALARASTLDIRPGPFRIVSAVPPIAAWQSDADAAKPPVLPPNETIVRLVESWIGQSPHGIIFDLASIARDVHDRSIDGALVHLLIGAALSYAPSATDVALCPESAGRYIARGQALLFERRLDDALATAQALVVLRGLRTVGLAPGSSLALSIVASISARWCIAALAAAEGDLLERELASNALWLSLVCAEWHSFAYDGEAEHRRAMLEDVALPALSLPSVGDPERALRQRQFAHACLLLRTLVYTEHDHNAESIPSVLRCVVEGESALF